MKNHKSIISLLKGLRILESFSPSQFNLSFQELVNKTGFPKTTVFRFLRTLVNHEYLTFDPKSKKYFMGPRVMSLGLTVLSSMDLREVALPYLNQLADASGQSVNLAILDNTEVVYIERIKKLEVMGINIHVGSRINSYQTSSGKAILAFLNEEKFDSLLNHLLKNAEAKKHLGRKGEKLIKKLKVVRVNGYALNDGEFIAGLRAIAAPIFNAKGVVEGAINLVVFGHMVTRKELIERYVPLLLNTAKNVSVARGFMQY